MNQKFFLLNWEKTIPALDKVFQIFWKIGTQNFSDFFLHKVTVAYRLEMDSCDFCGKTLKFVGQKKLRMKFSKFYEN